MADEKIRQVVLDLKIALQGDRRCSSTTGTYGACG
jgi:hypothetical protein